MSRNYMITKRQAEKYNIPLESLPPIWQWYGEYELDNVLCNDFYIDNEKKREEFKKDVVEMMDRWFSATLDVGIFDDLDSKTSKNINLHMPTKWSTFLKYTKEVEETFTFKKRNLNKVEALQFIAYLQNGFNLDLEEYAKSIMNSVCDEYEIVHYNYDKFKWSLESKTEYKVIIDGDMFNSILIN